MGEESKITGVEDEFRSVVWDWFFKQLNLIRSEHSQGFISNGFIKHHNQIYILHFYPGGGKMVDQLMS